MKTFKTRKKIINEGITYNSGLIIKLSLLELSLLNTCLEFTNIDSDDTYIKSFLKSNLKFGVNFTNITTYAHISKYLTDVLFYDKNKVTYKSEGNRYIIIDQ